MSVRDFVSIPVLALAAFGLLLIPPLSAQPTGGATSREVVQSLPTPEVLRLRSALERLADRGDSLDALVDAGEASVAVGDLDAALGFFGRALELSPENPRAKLGLAAVYLRSRRPIDALKMFAEAEQAGASTEAFLGDLGLVQDLVGNNEQAQGSYRTLLATRPDDETRRRLAISLAISGDRAGFEAALLPMLQKQDLAAHRTRAFGLAILGDTRGATALARQLMPADLASRMTPYLEYMPRLTKAQQAAAANLGIFPRAAEIGRDDPGIARLASSSDRSAARAGDRLAPRGSSLSERTAPPSRPAATTGSSSRLAEVSREQEARPPSVSEAFNGLIGPATTPAAASAGAVDITSIRIPRETREPVKPVAPAHPSRHWVQVATGRDRDALKFDWRRMARKVPDLLGKRSPHVVRWGQANRLLAGPFPTEDAARDMVRSLREQGMDSFTYTSPEGEEIVELK